MPHESLQYVSVGPVLHVGFVADAIISAIEEGHVERHLGRPIEFPRELEKVMPSFMGAFTLSDDRAEWSSASRQPRGPWQPLRETLEHLLVTYDWGEAFVGLNLVLKPLVDELFTHLLGVMARRRGDYVLHQILGSLAGDCQWHQQWSQALAIMALRDTPAHQGVPRGGWTSGELELQRRLLR